MKVIGVERKRPDKVLTRERATYIQFMALETPIIKRDVFDAPWSLWHVVALLVRRGNCVNVAERVAGKEKPC